MKQGPKGAVCLETSILKIFLNPLHYTWIILTDSYYLELYDIVTMQIIGKTSQPIWKQIINKNEFSLKKLKVQPGRRFKRLKKFKQLNMDIQQPQIESAKQFSDDSQEKIKNIHTNSKKSKSSEKNQLKEASPLILDQEKQLMQEEINKFINRDNQIQIEQNKNQKTDNSNFWDCIFSKNFNIFYIISKDNLYLCQLINGNIEYKKFIVPQFTQEISQNSLLVSIGRTQNYLCGFMLNRVWMVQQKYLYNQIKKIGSNQTNTTKKNCQYKKGYRKQGGNKNNEFNSYHISNAGVPETRSKSNIKNQKGSIIPMTSTQLFHNIYGSKQKSQSNQQILPTPPYQLLTLPYQTYLSKIIYNKFIICLTKNRKMISLEFSNEMSVLKIISQKDISQFYNNSSIEPQILINEKFKLLAVYNDQRVNFYAITNAYKLVYYCDLEKFQQTKIQSLCFFFLGVNTSSTNKHSDKIYSITAQRKRQKQQVQLYLHKLKPLSAELEHIINLNEIPYSSIWTNSYLDNHILYMTKSIDNNHNQSNQAKVKIINIAQSCSPSTSQLKSHYKEDILAAKHLASQWVCLGYKFQCLQKNDLYQERQDEFEINENQINKKYQYSSENIKLMEQLDDWSQSWIDQKLFWIDGVSRLNCLKFASNQ